MPFKDGYKTSSKIRKLYSGYGIPLDLQPRIIAITGSIESVKQNKAMVSGIDKIWTKPVHIKEMGQLLIKNKYITRLPSEIEMDD